MSQQVTEAAVIRLVKIWAPLLGLQRWRVRITFHATVAEESDDDKQACEAYVEVLPGYSSARITVNGYNVDAGELEEVVVHELAHILCAPLEHVVTSTLGSTHEELAEQLREGVACAVAGALIAARRGKPARSLVDVRVRGQRR